MLAWIVSMSLAVAPLCATDAVRSVCVAPTTPQRFDATGAPSAPDALGRGTWLVDEENDEVLLVTPFGSSRRFKVGRWPQQLVVASTGRVFVSCREEGRIDLIDPEFRQSSIAVGEEPGPLSLDELGQRLYVGLITAKAVVALDTQLLQPAARVDVAYAPRAIALTAGGLAVGFDRSPTIQFLDRATLVETSTASMQRVSGSSVGTRLLVPVGDGVLIVAEAAQTGLDVPVSSGGYGGGWFSPITAHIFSISDVSQHYAPAVERATFELPEPVQATVDNGRLIVASRGKGSVLVAGLWAESLTLGLTSELVLPHESDVVAMTTGPGGQLVFADALGRQLLETSLSSAVLSRVARPQPPPQRQPLGLPGTRWGSAGWRGVFEQTSWHVAVRKTPLPEGTRDAQLRAGARLFHAANDQRISVRGVACAGCHPDGREDGRVWQLTGTRRQTPMLTQRLHDTAPFNWLGGAKTLEANLRVTIVERLEGDGLGPKGLTALSRFVSEGLRPVTMPAPKEPELVALGQQVFNDAKVGCNGCHPSDLALTDGESHDVASVSAHELLEFRNARRTMAEEGVPMPGRAPKKFDTPSLKSVALTAPYFHDGAVASLDQLVADNADRMGNTSQLSDLQRRALVAYLQTL